MSNSHSTSQQPSNRYTKKRYSSKIQAPIIYHIPWSQEEIVTHTCCIRSPAPTPNKVLFSDSDSEKLYPCRAIERAYCESTSHYLTNCQSLKELSTDKMMQWLKEKNRCWKCGRTPQSSRVHFEKTLSQM